MIATFICWKNLDSCTAAHDLNLETRAALPTVAAGEADAIVGALCELLHGHRQGLVDSPSLEDVAAGIAHCLCAAQVDGSSAGIPFLCKTPV